MAWRVIRQAAGADMEAGSAAIYGASLKGSGGVGQGKASEDRRWRSGRGVDGLNLVWGCLTDLSRAKSSEGWAVPLHCSDVDFQAGIKSDGGGSEGAKGGVENGL